MSLSRLPIELLQRIADDFPRIEDMSALARVDRECHGKVNHRMYQRDARLGSSALLWAARHNNMDTARRSMAAGGRVDNTTGTFRSSPLHVAASFGKIEVAKLLISHGADLHAECSNGLTPLHFAIMKGRVQMVTTLLGAGASPKALTGSLQFTPLHIACFSGRPDMVATLLRHGAYVYTKDRNGETPLHWAVQGSITLGRGQGGLTTRWYEQRSVMVTSRELRRQKLCGCAGGLQVVKLLMEKKAEQQMSNAELAALVKLMEKTQCINGRGGYGGLRHWQVFHEQLLALIREKAQSAGRKCAIW
ncbi:ankyrin repeat-containing domain protein [Macrophomina phaseolina]|uniref:Ankyrin repeat-containing domain protein n=1 Tax=Macrophomina phaseolina TaxID=35725 RepID=A0ABQ8GGL1_9PEZI|nr:ankyrin repeat-containing domain protein [Macrophomina phaseolina]